MKTCIFFIAILLAGCQTGGKKTNWVNLPNLGVYSDSLVTVWENPDLKGSPPSIKDFELTKAKGHCTVKKLSLQIPSPSCVQPPKADCSTMDAGFSKGFCESYTPQPKCDYSSVDAAKTAQEEIWNACMVSKGWIRGSKRVIKSIEIDETSTSVIGGIFSLELARDDNYKYQVRWYSPELTGQGVNVIVRSTCLSYLNCKSHQGVWKFNLKDNVLVVDNEKPVTIESTSPADYILKHLRKREDLKL